MVFVAMAQLARQLYIGKEDNGVFSGR